MSKHSSQNELNPDNRKFILTPPSLDEAGFFYSSEKNDRDYGVIGHFRGDYSRSGTEWWSTWHGHRDELNVQPFKSEFNELINELRCIGFLRDRNSMTEYCDKHPECRLESSYGANYGFKVDTERHQYFIRCLLRQGTYDFYVYANDKSAQQITMDEQACSTGQQMGGM